MSIIQTYVIIFCPDNIKLYRHHLHGIIFLADLYLYLYFIVSASKNMSSWKILALGQPKLRDLQLWASDMSNCAKIVSDFVRLWNTDLIVMQVERRESDLSELKKKWKIEYNFTFWHHGMIFVVVVVVFFFFFFFFFFFLILPNLFS